MDPLSVIGVTLGLLEFTVLSTETVVKYIAKLRVLPDDLCAVSNDVNDFRSILLRIDEYTRQERDLARRLTAHGGVQDLNVLRSLTDTFQTGQGLISRAKNRVGEIETLVAKYTKSQQKKGISALTRIVLRDHTRLKSLREGLRAVQQSITTHFSITSSTCSLRSAVIVENISGELHKVSQESESHGRILENVVNRLGRIAAIEDEQRRSSDLIESLSRSISTPFIPTECSFRTASAVNATTERALATSDTLVKLDISRFSKLACRPFCSCACHTRRRPNTPTLPGGILGSLFVGYSSLPIFGPPCEPGCVSRSRFSATFTYYFPTWFFHRMLSLVLVTTALGDPGLCLKIRKISFQDFSLFRFASMGDWMGIKSLLDRGLDHPSSSWCGGWTALHYAVANGNALVCKYLLSRQADVLLEDGADQESSLSFAWKRILGKAFSSGRLAEFRSIFPNSECVEEFGFTLLHKVVLELHGADLRETLALHPELINAVDNDGKTPLHWVCERGDVDKARVLLDHGADPHLLTRARVSTLISAARAQSPDCILPLVRAGVPVDLPNWMGETALLLVCGYLGLGPELGHIRILLEAGADPNAATNYAYTPLIEAVCHDHVAAVQLLLSAGANINYKGQNGQTPLHFAIEWNSHAALQALIEAGADCTISADTRGPTTIHFAARFADLTTLKILVDKIGVTFVAEQVLSPDHEGLTIEDLVNARVEREHLEGFAELFDQLLSEIFIDGYYDTVPYQAAEWEADGDTWEDAQEALSCLSTINVQGTIVS